MPIARGEVWEVQLFPQRGAEMKKVRPCVVISGDKIGKLPLKVVVPIRGSTEIRVKIGHILDGGSSIKQLRRTSEAHV